MRSALFFCGAVLLLSAILWTAGVFRKSGERSFAANRQYDKVSDFTGTVWENQGGKSTIYFLSPDHLVYSFFDPDIYDEDDRRKIRAVYEYNFTPSFKTFTISRLGMQFGVNLVFKTDSTKKEIGLVDQENNQQWLPETRSEYINKAK